ncbi:hypothetical protein [Scytonema sp. UIC 10036]|uniref:hypothetical protein n=1 Tax=Scytonema sp. UIC 10036 TaxID=2304196 RepID=UPI00140F88DE|nr:hypothetical protein [Scytonema sp. UIC 10036]
MAQQYANLLASPLISTLSTAELAIFNVRYVISAFQVNCDRRSRSLPKERRT